MAKTFPIGHVRVNPNTFMSEVWNGSTWLSSPTASGTISAYNLNNNGNTITTSSVRSSFSETERELMFEFLKQNLRVAEYRDGNSKIESVELQMRLGPGYEWETIRREKIIRSKTKI